MYRQKGIKSVLVITLLLNILVALMKVIYGYVVDSVSIRSDGFHSLFDGVSNVIGLIALKLSSQPPDSKHHYGHRKVETLFTIFIGLVMLVTCFEILKNTYEALFKGEMPSISYNSFLVMSFTFIVNIFVYFYETTMGKRLRSEYLIADAKHTLSDIFITIGVIFALILQWSGITFADAVVGLIVGVFIGYTGIVIIKESSDVLIDRSYVDDITIREIVCMHNDVIECHEIRARGAKGDVFVDLHILVSPEMSVLQAHRIAHEVEDAIKLKMPEIKDVVIHIEPKEKE
ncbi:MAG: cation diffusion facilitator family transporter [Thermodesulfovibrionales bacterium]|nr:cation diffusion facilitator family transporter [Thermodesulfovibrionales bacterium]